MAYGGQSSPEGSLLLENFECSICLQIFTRPKILPCGHTFCMECLVPLAKGSNSVKCPTCQTSVKLRKTGRAGVEALTDNILVANLREDAQASGRRQTRGPQGAENPTAVSDESMCPKHSGEELRYYCPPCDVAICEDCMLEDHNTHGVNRLRKTLLQQTAKAREVSEEGKRLMKQIRGKIAELENSKKRLEKEESTQVKAVDKTAQKLAEDFASEVIKCANALKAELHIFFAPSNKEVLDGKERLEIQLAQLASSIEALETCINQRDAIVVFSGRKMLNDLIKQSSQTTIEELGVRHNTPVFTPTPYSLPKITLGKVQDVKKPSEVEADALKDDLPAPSVDDVARSNETAETDGEWVKIPGLKYKYRADQWSPLNPEGKKQYDRSFLLQFQPECIDKPDGLPKIVDVVLNKPHSAGPQQIQVQAQSGRPTFGTFIGGSPPRPEDYHQPRAISAYTHHGSAAQQQGIPLQQGRHPHTAPSPHDMNKGGVSSQGPPPVVGTPPTGPSPGPQMSQQTQMYASVSMSQGHRSSQPQYYISSGPTANGRVPYQTGPRYSAPQTVTSAPPPQMFQPNFTNQMIPGHVPQQAYPQPTLFTPQQYRPQAIPHFQPPQSTIQSATAFFQPAPQGPGPGGTQTTYRTGEQLQYYQSSGSLQTRATRQQRPPSTGQSSILHSLWPELSDYTLPKSQAPVLMDTVRLELENLMKEKADNDRIVAWIEKNVDATRLKETTFIRALMTAVCRSAIIGEGKKQVCDTQAVQKRVVLLQKYLDNDSTRELQALFALQALMVQLDQPPNLLRMFFDTLYVEDVISEDAFFAWESNTDPAEQEGKKVALKSVTAFFSWLREAEEHSSDDN